MGNSMVDDKKTTLEMLAEKLEVWPKDASCELHPKGWRWIMWAAIDGVSLASTEKDKFIHKLEWEDAKAELKCPVWKEGDETTEGTIAYVSTEHKNVMVRSTHGIREFDGRFLQRKKDPTQAEFIMDRLVKYYGPALVTSEVFEKIIVDALIDWEAEQNV